jgi:hypothetical protein
VADTETLKPRHPGGRPSKYTKTACTAIVECGKQGMSLPEMASELDVARSTLFEWANEHPEFSDALSRAQDEAEAFWAKSIRNGLQKAPSEYQGPANLKYMAQRFKGWSEKAHVDTKEIAPTDDPATPDDRSAARRVAMLLAKGVQRAE